MSIPSSPTHRPDLNPDHFYIKTTAKKGGTTSEVLKESTVSESRRKWHALKGNTWSKMPGKTERTLLYSYGIDAMADRVKLIVSAWNEARTQALRESVISKPSEEMDEKHAAAQGTRDARISTETGLRASAITQSDEGSVSREEESALREPITAQNFSERIEALIDMSHVSAEKRKQLIKVFQERIFPKS